MRNLKKILALVLSLMMVLSVMVTASAADFSDADEIQYAEAVDVLNGLDILTGSQGKFAPKGTLTRAQAAKIITFIALGEDTNKLVKGTGSAQFSDVTGGWAYDYVSYCANEKIISGSQGKFFPDAEVTGYQFGKMVLNVLGIEGTYTGSGWELRVATALKSEDLLAGLADSFTLKAKLTREEAAQIAFNAMNYVTETVYGYRIYTLDGTTKVYAKDFYATLAEAAVAASALTTAGAGTYKVDTTKVAVNNSLGHKGYGLDSYEGTVNGIGGHVWYVYDPAYAITGVYADDAVLSETSDGTSLAKLTSPKGTAAYDASKFVALVSAPTYYYNGNKVLTPVNGAKLVKGDYYLASDGKTIKLVNENATYGTSFSATAVLDITSYGKGVTVKLVNEAGTNAVYAEKVLFEVPEYTSVLSVKAVAETKLEGAHTLYKLANGAEYKVYTSKVTTKDITNVSVYEGIAAKDKVLVTALKSGKAVVSKVDTITGKLTATSTADSSYTINGTKYFLSGIKGIQAFTPDFKAEHTYVLDANGYIVAVVDGNTAPEFLYIVATPSGETWTLVDGKLVKSIVATAMFSDGSYADVVVAKVDGGAATTSNVVAGLYTYEMNAKGAYVLTAKIAAVTETLTAKNPKLATDVYANTSTKFVYSKWTKDSDGNTVFGGTVVYTGYTAIPAAQAGATASYVDVPVTGSTGDGIAEVVFVNNYTAAVTEVTFAWYLGTKTVESTAAGTQTSYDVVIDGVKTTLVDTTGLTDVGLYSVSTTNVATKLTDSTTPKLNASAKLVYNGGLLFVGGTYNSAIAEDAIVYVMDSTTGAVTTGVATDLTEAEAVTGQWVAVEDTTTHEIVTLYVVK